ncbi:MAG: hypothetical protein ACRCSY_07940 [Cetobacterium sp.]
MNINYKKFFLRTFLPSVIIYTIFRYFSYQALGYFYALDFGDLFLFFILNVVIELFWGLLEYFQNVTGMLMKESWVSRIIFILVALVLFYLYRINGRI